MNSYDKKKNTIKLYQIMTKNIEDMARKMYSKPESYVPSEYAKVPKISDDVKKVIKEAARLILDEIRTIELEIYKL